MKQKKGIDELAGEMRQLRRALELAEELEQITKDVDLYARSLFPSKASEVREDVEGALERVEAELYAAHALRGSMEPAEA